MERERDRFETGLVLVLYVLPLGASVVFLAAVGLAGLALALLAVEAGVSAGVVAAKRPRGRAGRLPVVLAAVSVLAAVAAVVSLSQG